MDVSIGSPWQEFVDALVAEGRYASASDVIGEGLRLIQQREVKLASLRCSITAAIAAGGTLTDAEVEAALDAAAERQGARGIPA